MIWLTYDRAWGGSFDTIYKQQFIDNFAITANELQPIKFQGQCLDTETGLHYNRFRYYDSDVGMFISRDPIGLLGGSNVFQYAPNPVMWIDPWGLSTVYLRNTEVYVGKAKVDARTRYGNKSRATDIFTDIPNTDTAQGVEQIVYEEMLDMRKEGVLNEDLTNAQRPVNMSDKNKVYRRKWGFEWLKDTFGDDYQKVIRQKVIDHYKPRGKCNEN